MMPQRKSFSRRISVKKSTFWACLLVWWHLGLYLLAVDIAQNVSRLVDDRTGSPCVGWVFGASVAPGHRQGQGLRVIARFDISAVITYVNSLLR